MSPWKEKVHQLIYEADTPKGKVFDLVLLVLILLSVLVVMLESVESINAKYHNLFVVLEWVFTIFFTIEYILRLLTVMRPIKYATSFFGVIDLLAIIPTYFSLIFPGTHYLLAVRGLRLLRIFRILKLAKFVKESYVIMEALKASRAKISVFMFFVLILTMVLGSLMYLIEGTVPDTGFTSIPRSIYWAIVTITTVGYGDISPITSLGQFIAAVLMLIGYSIIAVPTGIVTSEFTNEKQQHHADHLTTQACRSCSKEGHEDDAIYCKYCGEAL